VTPHFSDGELGKYSIIRPMWYLSFPVTSWLLSSNYLHQTGKGRCLIHPFRFSSGILNQNIGCSHSIVPW